jgi:phosphatidylinositol-3,4,5-trisphosphate 3-phosphatase/dual-specificity protein phosphatase PTEN
MERSDSERRWCRYIHLLFTNQAPPSYLSQNTAPQRLRLKSVTMYLRPPTGWKKPIASLVVGGHGGNGVGKAWASVARYEDEYVKELYRRGGDGESVDGDITWGGVGGEGTYDTEKMFKSCGKMVETENEHQVVDHKVSASGTVLTIGIHCSPPLAQIVDFHHRGAWP